MDYPPLHVKNAYILILVLVARNLPAAGVKPPAQIHTRGIPAIPAKLAEQAKPYLQVRAVRFQDWHPVKKHMLLTQRPKGGQVSQLHVVEKAGGALRQLTRGKEPVRSARYQPVDGRSLIFNRDEGGSERYQVFHLDLATGKTTRLTDGKNRHTGAHWLPDGKRVVYFSPKRNGRDNDLYVVDPAKPGSEKLLSKLPGGGWWLEDWSADGELMILLEYISITNTRLHILDANTGERSLFTPKLSEEVSYRNARFDSQRRAIYYTCDEDSNFQYMVRLDFKTGERKRYLGEVKWDVEAFELSPNGQTLAVIHNEGGASRLRFVDVAGEKLPAQQALHTAFPSGVVRNIEWHREGAEFVYDFEWALSPGEIRTIKIGEKGKTSWAVSDTGQLNLNQISIPFRREITSVDGVKFDTWVYSPGRMVNGKFILQPQVRGVPVVILFHGGPESQFRPRFMGRYNYLMSEERIALLCPNVRGSRGYGKRHLKADNGMDRASVMLDVQRLRNAISADSYFDANRIAVMGGSYGGFMTLHSMVVLNNFVKCGVDVVGISNFVTFLKNTSDYRRDLRRVEYGDERDPKMRKFLQELSPLTHVNEITRPLLIVQGANDPRVPASESEQMEKALRKNGIETWYLLAKDEGHGFRKQSNREFQFLTTIQFLRKHLLEQE